jgi:hypothetical protein
MSPQQQVLQIDDHQRLVFTVFQTQKADSVYDSKLEEPSICKAVTFPSSKCTYKDQPDKTITQFFPTNSSP